MELMEEVDRISSETHEMDAQAEKEEKYIPAGTYEGTIFTWNKVEEEKKSPNSQYRGVPQYKIGVRLYDCPEFGGQKTGWFSMTTTRMINETTKKKKACYKSADDLATVLGMLDADFRDVLEQAKVTRLRYVVGGFEAEKDGPNGEKVMEKINFLSGVKAL